MLHTGARLGDRYVLLEPLARGGMGEVWRAEDTVLGRIVALKVLLPALSGDPGFAERFRTEARAMAALSDPNIVEVYDYGQDQGVAYLVMQLVPGEALYSLLSRVGPLPAPQAMGLVAQAARALHQAHSIGIVHRDVKPGNLLMRPDGRLVLTDFGIARIVAAERFTAAGDIVGTASYLAPEQVLGAPIGPAADIYALGVVAYECLAGVLPFVADTPIAVALMQARDVPPPLPPSVPDAVRHLVMRALAKDPGQRWPSAAAMAQAAMATGGPWPGRTVPAERRPPMAPRRVPTTVARPTHPPMGPSSGIQRGGYPVDDVGDERSSRRGRVIGLVTAAVALIAVLAWAGLSSLGGDGGTVAAAPPTPTSSGAGSLGVPATPTPTPTPTPAPTTATPTTATTTKAATAPRTTAPRTAGPNERVVPDLYHRGLAEADYMIRNLGLVPDYTVVTQPDTCWVILQDPKATTIVAVGSTVKFTVAKSASDCGP